MQKKESGNIGIISLIISSSTLICCALPAMFVAIGAGATLASLVGVFPQLIILSKYKIFISVITLFILLAAGLIIKKSESLPCPIDPKMKSLCLKTRKRSKNMYYASVIIFIMASTFTYILPRYI